MAREIQIKFLIATSKNEANQGKGDEKLDDPIPLIGENSIFVITRYKTSIHSSEETRYKVYEFAKDLEKIREFDLDLSSVADGGPRQSSAMYRDGYYYMVLPTTVGQGSNEFDTPSDILLVKFNNNWDIVESEILSENHADIERYMAGFEMDEKYLYLAYNLKDDNGLSIPLKIYDNNYNLILVEKILAKYGVMDVEITDDKIFAGISSSFIGDKEFNSDVYVYKIVSR